MKGLFGCLNAMENQKPYIAMLLVQSVYAGMALFSKAAIARGMNSFVFVVYRQAFASVSLVPFAFFLERKEAAPLSYGLLFKIFLVSFCGVTLSLNLYYIAINYTTATLAAATTNAIPAITFVMAALLRMESISIKHVHGIAKVLGSVIGFSGVLVIAFVKGPPIKFMNWNPANDHGQIQDSSKTCCSREEWIKGSLLMISANTLWSLWLVLQGPIIKQYPAKLRLTTLQCMFSCIQSAFWAIAVERNPSSWKLGWDVNLLSVAYCSFNLSATITTLTGPTALQIYQNSSVLSLTFNMVSKGIVVTGITYWLQIWTIEKKGPVFTSMFTPFALIITAIFSAFLWKETFNWGSVGGDVLLVSGLYGVLWGKKKEDGRKPVIPMVALDQSLCSPISKPNEVYKDGKRSSLISGIANLLLSKTMANRKRRGDLKSRRPTCECEDDKENHDLSIANSNFPSHAKHKSHGSATIPDTRALSLPTMPDPTDLDLEAMSDSRCLGLIKAFNSSPYLDLKRQEKKKQGRWRQRRKGCKRRPCSHVSDDKNAISGSDGSTTDLKPSLGSHLRRLIDRPRTIFLLAAY
ncbi:hypothetical protein NC653_014403 [Populus alba x Populus x berolinensis]|uniref:EamA domain-containing protein n=1 Tax=Populus alba x Populus x berolinensis TaxID=444605 RepID=A0AAD6QWV2_9ROSI|nr:hypothetical protein NC653_014403 [Populus alba x Populus x berolinensis]